MLLEVWLNNLQIISLFKVCSLHCTIFLTCKPSPNPVYSGTGKLTCVDVKIYRFLYLVLHWLVIYQGWLNYWKIQCLLLAPPPLQTIGGDTVNARAVHILLECNLVIYFLIIKINVSERGGTDHLYLFTYGNWLLITCAFCFNINYLFVYLFKLMSTKAAQVTTCFYLLMEIGCWLHVLFVLIFSIYLFIYSNWCQQKQRKSPPVFIYLWKLVVD